MTSPRRDADGAARGASQARLYTIPATAPFLDTLARAILNGDLPEPGGPAPALLDLPAWTVLLPTRRAARAMREAFLRARADEAALLPRIRAIGDVDEDAALFAPVAESAQASAQALDLPPAIGELDRLLALTSLVLKRMQATHAAGLADEAGFGAAPPPAAPAQALALAGELVTLMDAVDTEQADLARLADIVPDRFAAHWQETLDFLRIVTEHWPRHLEEHGVLSPAQRRNALMAAECERLAAHPPAAPVIAAGSTGSVPATAALLNVIAGLPNGAVVLPGLDMELDAAGWGAIADHPEHPQYGIKQLLAHMGVERARVRWLAGSAPDGEARARLRLVAEAMRPAADTARWQDFAARADKAALRAALAPVELVEAATAREEAEIVALMLRGAAEAPGRTAALVTPDRALARRVAARLEKWELTVNDSAGRPLAKTPPGVFLDLVAEAARSAFEPVPLMALLKHPLTRLGLPPAAVRHAARVLELAAFRQPVLAQGLDGAAKALARAREELSGGGYGPAVLRWRSARDWQAAEDLIAALAQAFAPLAALGGGRHPLPALARAHVQATEALARDEAGGLGALWRGEAGEALALLLAELVAADSGGPPIAAADYADFYRGLLAGRVARPRAGAHARLFIWGPLEARLQRPDLAIIGGLNDGVWPRHEDTDAWLSRPMRAAVGLTPPERRTGLAAHDFAQAMGAERVVLTRARKVDGVPTVPSRWLLRLTTLLKGLGLEDALKSADPWPHWARARDLVGMHAPARQPKPCPPVAARPRRLSVTRIEDWIANPYAIFARHILGLVALDSLAGEPDAALRGQIVHDVLNAFAREHPDRLPADIAAEIMRIANAQFEQAGAHARIRAFWRPQFARFARWLAETEPARRAGVKRVHAEVMGEMAIGDGPQPFRLTARADRIDECEDGTLAIYDYKTGGLPNYKQVAELIAPQLPLEAAIAAAGGFDGVPAAPAAHLRYIRILGRTDQAGEERDAVRDGLDSVVEEAVTRLRGLVAAFDRPDTPYRALRRHRFADKYRFDDYAQLARVDEWPSGGEEAS